MKSRINKRELRDSVCDKAKKMFFTQSTLEKNLCSASIAELQLVSNLFDDELETRRINRRARYQKQAGFPVPKSFTTYDFNGINFPHKLPQEKMLSLEFIRNKEVILFYGSCGSGKTHAMTALGIKACNSDYKVKFYTVSQLIMKLKTARKEGMLEKLYKTLDKQDLICLDEFGYVPMDLEGGQLLFQVISAAYERQSLILTTNLPFNAWGPIFSDEQLAAAVIDRIVHHGHMVKTGNKDWRLEHSLMAN